MDDDDNIAIMTLPYNNDLSALYNQTNNIVVLILLLFQITVLGLNVLASFIIPSQASRLKIGSSPLLSPYALVIYCHLLSWLLMVLVRFYLRQVYYSRLRIIGFHKHHKLAAFLALVPAFVLHKSNALLLLVTTILCKIETENLKLFGVHLEPINFPQMIISVATSVIFPFLIKLLYHEIKFRKSKNPPDVFCVDDPQHLEQAGLSDSALSRSSTQYFEELLEKQSDLIYNLKLQNSHLRMMLYKVTQQRASMEIPNT